MGFIDPTFLLGAVVVFYLFSFVLFAIVRITTGISIQRLGYFSLRRISYTHRDGVRFDLRGLGLYLHRPTFAQPTWLSLRLTELKVTVDPKALAESRVLKTQHASADKDGQRPDTSRSQTWRRLTLLKERIKRLHEKIQWLRMLDVEVLNSSCVVKSVGNIQIGSLTMAVDTRRKTVDRGRLFQHKMFPRADQRPAEWIFVLRSVLFTPDGKESLEILDVLSLNIHGLLYKDLAGLRDASISLKLGRIHIPYDDILDFDESIKYWRRSFGQEQTKYDISITDVMEELDRPGSREENIVQTVSDSKEFISSILRGIQEIQLAVSYVGLSRQVKGVQSAGSPLYLNAAMNEIAMDLFRLDPKSPAHRMYFATRDIAHQALLAAISIALSVDDGKGKPERILYIPMATTTIKTTLPSKTVAKSEDKDAAARNANMLFANLVVTSPSVDLDLKHMPLAYAFLESQEKPSRVPTVTNHGHRLISRLLPKANIKFSVHEPVTRISLPPADTSLGGTDEYDLLISSISSMSLDVESSHSSAGELDYSLTSNLRVAQHHLYYQAAAGERYDLLNTNAFELQLHVFASPEVRVAAVGNLQTLLIHMCRPELSTGIHHIVRHFRKHSASERSTPPPNASKPAFLRRLPPWLVHVQFQGSNFGLDLGGVDANVSRDTRGCALQLESWNAEYKMQKSTSYDSRPRKGRAMTASDPATEALITITSPQGVEQTPPDTTDGRRLAIHVRGFQGFVVEGLDRWEPEPFLSIPRFEVALSTSNDSGTPIFHINSHIRALYVQYSLYRYYAIGVAYIVLKRAFVLTDPKHDKASVPPPPPSSEESFFTEKPEKKQSATGPEIVTVDVKAGLLQAKATMPADPCLMLQIYGVEAGRHRWTVPFIRSRLGRLYAETPKVRSTWSRMVSIKNWRVDLRESRKKQGKIYINENSIDLTTDFIRVAVPHQLVLHEVFDNIVNVGKATEQLNHCFKTGTNEYILKKQPEQPKKVPRISIRSKAMMFELEDGPFEWKLGTIYRIGLAEQKQRLAREDAFEMKVRTLKESEHRRGSSRNRTASAHPNGRGRKPAEEMDDVRQRSKSDDGRPSRRQSPIGHERGRHMRYDPDGICGLTGASKLSAQQAWYKLQEYNSQSWRKRINKAMSYQRRSMREIRSMFWGNDELPESAEENETIISMPDRPGLMTTLITDLHVIIDKPSFPLKDYPQFLHKAGKGMPYDMQYSLLVPMGIQINMGEARVTLRDYPLPILHVPAIKPGQSARLPSWSLKTDFVIAEEFRDDESVRQVKVDIVPRNKICDPTTTTNFGINVRRTISAVKTYSEVEISINTSNPTSITWGTSYQPAIQDMMMIIEGFTKPQVDPSDRVGFWDKIRLSFHSRVNVVWKGDGDVILKLKGARDPYKVTGHGAGFVMCWRNNVRWGVHLDDDPKKFMTVSSGEYVLAIPDYSHQARASQAQSSVQDTQSLSSVGSGRSNSMFKKVIMKLSGNVRWLAGLVFERDIGHGGRSFEFSPHYNIALKNPAFARPSAAEAYDAFRGFRSNHIHLSIAVVAPLDRDWSLTNLKPSNSYNTVHLSPRFFTHFFDWWSLFSAVMSLPIRQGKLFPGPDKSSKKFGRHLATIKYNLLLSPLFIAHIYKHKDAEDYAEETVSATGLKLRLDSFMLDLHQRREEFATSGKGRAKQMKSSGMRINQAQLDFISADIRAVSASIAGTTADDVERATAADLASYEQAEASNVDISRFTIPDQDFLWIDMDDFVELDWILPAQSNPETKIMPLAFAPRFTYFRQTDHPGSKPSNDTGSSPFGNEPTHYCIMSHDNDPRRVQYDLFRERLSSVEQQIRTHDRIMDEQELFVIRDGVKDPSLQEKFEILKRQGQMLRGKQRVMQTMLQRLSVLFRSQDSVVNGSTEFFNFDADTDHEGVGIGISGVNIDSEYSRIEEETQADIVSDFNNRFIIHNVQLKWNNSLRNIILRYVHQVSQRRGFVYYMSRRAVKFILDIVEEQNKHKQRRAGEPESVTPSGQTSPNMKQEETSDDLGVEDRIQQLLNDGKKFVDANDPSHAESENGTTKKNLGHNISEDYAPLNSYHVRLIAPQIQLQSEKNAKSVLMVTAKGMQLKVIQIMDKDRMSDDVSGLVQRRFSVDMEGVQFFVSNQKKLNQFLHLYSANSYGTPKGTSWPPWVPIEANFDFELDPYGFSRVVQRTSASLRYDKYNTLRLKYNDEVNKGEAGHESKLDDPESRIDHLWVDFPHIRAICDSTQYYAMYLIVLDLLLYNEPIEKVRSEKLEKIMLASDFSDLRGAPEMVISLQARIRQLEEINGHFQINSKYLDKQGWQDRLAIEKDLTSCEDELFFMMKAITTSQRKTDDRAEGSQSNGLLRWYLTASEIVWHLMREMNEPLMEIQLQNAAYDRMDNSDGSNHNLMEIERIKGLNLLPDALYPEMLAPYFEAGKSINEGQDLKMFKVKWLMLEAIAGIPVLDQFEVNLFPVKIQLEREIGKKIFDYIFPEKGDGDMDKGGISPFMVKHRQNNRNEDDESDAEGVDKPLSPTNGALDVPSQQSATRAGSLELRLHPTLNLPEESKRPSTSAVAKPVNAPSELHPFSIFRHPNRSQTAIRSQSMRQIPKKRSGDSMSALGRTSNDASSTTLASMNGTTEKSKRFAMHRSASRDSHTVTPEKEKEKPSDDLTEMLSRASNYMTLAYVKIPSVVLCLSYKGKGERNIEDVHNFVFRMPVLEYRNKTWSNLDLALRLKKDVIKALISHTGAIIGNKFSHHRPSKTQQSRLREIANSSSLLPHGSSLLNHSPFAPSSVASSLYNRTPRDSQSELSSSRPSTAKGRSLNHTKSFTSSINSTSSPANGFMAEPDAIPETEEDDFAHRLLAHNPFSRRPNEGQRFWQREASVSRTQSYREAFSAPNGDGNKSSDSLGPLKNDYKNDDRPAGPPRSVTSNPNENRDNSYGSSRSRRDKERDKTPERPPSVGAKLRKESTIHLGRVTHDLQLLKKRGTTPEGDGEGEMSRRQSVIHIGKKILGSLN